MAWLTALFVVTTILMTPPCHGQTDVLAELASLKVMVSLMARENLESAVDDTPNYVNSMTCSAGTPATSLPIAAVPGIPDAVSGEAKCHFYCQNFADCKGFNFRITALADGTQCQLFTSTTGPFAVVAGCQFYKAVQQAETLYGSCKEIKTNDPLSPTGIYSLITNTGRILKRVYCEMGLNGGGYTFIHPDDYIRLTDAEVQPMFTDKTNFLLRVKLSNGNQPYGVLKQLTAYASTPLNFRLNQATGYVAPANSVAPYLGTNYAYFVIHPLTTPAAMGIQVNGASVSFTACDNNRPSYFALFPNLDEKTPTSVGNSDAVTAYPFYSQIIGALKKVPSGRALPDDFFMFLETRWGGCGAYVETDGRVSALNVEGVTIGFR